MEQRPSTSGADSIESGRAQPREYEASHRVVVIVIAVFVLGLIGTALAAILIPFDVADEVNSMRVVQTRIVEFVRAEEAWPRDWGDLAIREDDPTTAELMEKVEVDFSVTLDEVAAMMRERGVDVILAGELSEYDSWRGLTLVRYTAEMERFESEARAKNRQFMRELAVVMVSRNLVNRVPE